jgi:signal peptidase I
VDRQLIINDKRVPMQLGNADGVYRYAVEQLDGRDVTIAIMPERPARDFDQVVPPARYVVFGDSRDNARDSRYIGSVPRENIVGRVVKTFQPKHHP